jgi:hypothetical protein
MSVFKKLSSLNQDIELLESFGDIKAATILHKKFIKEAQQSLMPSRESGPYKQVFDKYFLSASTNPSQNLINSIRADGFLLREDQDKLVNYITEMMRNKATVAPTVAPTAAPTAATPTTTTEFVELAKLAPMTSQPQQPQQEQQLADPSQNLFDKLLNEAKYYLSINDFNNAATIRQQAKESEMYQNQKIAWEQQYNILVQNYSGTAPNNQASPQYNAQNQAQSDIYNAAKSIGLEYITPQNIAFYEQKIRQKLYQSGKLNANTQQLLRQISLSEYFIHNPQA